MTSPFHLKSTWSPPHEILSPKLASCFADVYREITQQKSFLKVTNLSAEDRDALQSLRLSSDRIINKADKGNNVVLQDKEDYLFEI